MVTPLSSDRPVAPQARPGPPEGTARDRRRRPAGGTLPSVSVVIPARDAEATIAASLDSVLSQDYAGAVEVIVADGSETAAMSEMIRRRYPGVRLVPNPDGTIVPGINAALRVAAGEVIVRCDAHSFLPPGYVRRAIETLEKTGAANVGGRQVPVGRTWFERSAALAMSTPLGAGDARHRIGGADGPVDSAYLGVFRRDVLDAVGGYDPVMISADDCEFNWRLREHGATIWFDSGLEATYRPRATFAALARQYFNYGRWRRVMLQRHPAAVRSRHLAAPSLLAGLAAAVFLGWTGAPPVVSAALPSLYVSAVVVGSLAVGIRRREFAALLLPLVLATMHVTWGAGFFCPPRSPRRGTARTTARTPGGLRGELRDMAANLNILVGRQQERDMRQTADRPSAGPPSDKGPATMSTAS